MSTPSSSLPRERVFEAVPDLDTRLLPRLRELPCFREATAAEIDESFAAYQAGDIEGVIAAWERVAEPTRATLPGAVRWAYLNADKGPKLSNALIFLASLRAVLAAGVRFRATLRADVQEVVHGEFPWLEHRHEHVPEGYTPEFEFPEVMREYVEWGTLDDSRARWQLVVAINEVQQCWYSKYAAKLFRLPELARHGERERQLARNYFAHWAPRCTRDLWRETIYVLDAINAAVFDLIANRRPAKFTSFVTLGIVTQRSQWRAFVDGLDQPQWLLPVE